MLYGHGDNGYLHPQELLADFSSNVWYGGEPAGLKEHLFHRWKLINRYPEVLAESLTQRVSRHHGLSPENILIDNGTIESIYLLAQLFKRKKTSIVFPSFSEYEDACRIHEHALQFLPWSALENWIAPGLMVLVTSSRRGIHFIFRYGHQHKSPNAGCPEAALAGILDARFGGPDLYHGILVEKPFIGINDRLIQPEEITRVSGINHRSCLLMITLLIIVLLF